MPFSEEVVRQAWENAGGQCQCKRQGHPHFYIPCGKPLVWEKRGKPGWGGWEAHHKDSFKGDGLDNCEILCYTCNEITY